MQPSNIQEVFTDLRIANRLYGALRMYDCELIPEDLVVVLARELETVLNERGLVMVIKSKESD